MKFKIIFLLLSSLLFSENNLDLKKIVYGDLAVSFKGDMTLHNFKKDNLYSLKTYLNRVKIEKEGFGFLRLSSLSIDIEGSPSTIKTNSVIKYDLNYNILHIMEEKETIDVFGKKDKSIVFCALDKTEGNIQKLLCNNDTKREYETKIENTDEDISKLIITKIEHLEKNYSITEKTIFEINSDGKITNISIALADKSSFTIKYNSIKIEQK